MWGAPGQSQAAVHGQPSPGPGQEWVGVPGPAGLGAVGEPLATPGHSRSPGWGPKPEPDLTGPAARAVQQEQLARRPSAWSTPTTTGGKRLSLPRSLRLGPTDGSVIAPVWPPFAWPHPPRTTLPGRPAGCRRWREVLQPPDAEGLHGGSRVGNMGFGGGAQPRSPCVAQPRAAGPRPTLCARFPPTVSPVVAGPARSWAGQPTEPYLAEVSRRALKRLAPPAASTLPALRAGHSLAGP